MIFGILILIYIIGLVSFSQWGAAGGIAETCVMALLVVMTIKLQYDRIKKGGSNKDNSKVYGILCLFVMLCLASVCHIPAGPWINRALLLGLTLIHAYGYFAVKDDRKLKNSFLPALIFGILCIVVTFLGFDMPGLL